MSHFLFSYLHSVFILCYSLKGQSNIIGDKRTRGLNFNNVLCPRRLKAASRYKLQAESAPGDVGASFCVCLHIPINAHICDQ